MTQYNPNDFYPRTGAEINSSGNVVNDADGINSDGSKNIVISRRNQNTIQTHNAVSVAASSSSTESSFHDANGFDRLAVTITNDSGSASYNVTIFWSNDGVNIQGSETILGNGNGGSRSAITDTKARYFKLSVYNGDAASHVISAWAFAKA